MRPTKSNLSSRNFTAASLNCSGDSNENIEYTRTGQSMSSSIPSTSLNAILNPMIGSSTSYSYQQDTPTRNIAASYAPDTFPSKFGEISTHNTAENYTLILNEQNQARNEYYNEQHTPSTTKYGNPKKKLSGRKNMYFSQEEKRERNRYAVKKCRGRQFYKFEALKQTATRLEAENELLEKMMQEHLQAPSPRNKLTQNERLALIQGMQMSVLLKLKRIFTQGLPKEIVAQSDVLWTDNAVLSSCMPTKCYIGIKCVRDYWQAALKMKRKGKIPSFWAWIFSLPPNERFTRFSIHRQFGENQIVNHPNRITNTEKTSMEQNSNHYCIQWTTNSTPIFSGAMTLHFGVDHRLVFLSESFGWDAWQYLLSGRQFPAFIDKTIIDSSANVR